jgi:hypothetical protein
MKYDENITRKQNRIRRLSKMPESVKIFEGKKFMWDGETYEGMDQAKEKEEAYKKDKFDTRIIEEEGKPVIYTRREVTEVEVEGQP